MRRRKTLSAFSAGIALLAMVGGGWVYSEYRRDIGVEHERLLSRSAVVNTPCGLIEYAVAGAGPPVLIVHGAGGGFDQGMDFGEQAARSGLRVIAMSRFGYLRTPLPADATPAAQADAHACLLTALGIRRAAVIGASAGAPSAMQFALRHPERVVALVLAVPAAYVPRRANAPSVLSPAATWFLVNTAMRSDFLFWAATRFARRSVIGFILATPPEVVEHASASEQQRVQRTLEHILPVSPRRIGLLNDGAVTSTLPRYDLERIVAPTLLISCRDDRFGTYDIAAYTAAHIPGAHFLGYPSGGHLWVGHAEEVAVEISGFLTRAFDAER